MKRRNIYFAGSIRGQKLAQESYQLLIQKLREHGEILTEHVAHAYMNPDKYNIAPTKKDIFEADYELLQKANVMVAEISASSHGVGRELSYAQCVAKMPILALHITGVDTSAMIGGNEYIDVREYTDIDDAYRIIDEWFLNIDNQK